MANTTTQGPAIGASAPAEDLPPPYAAVVGNQQYGFMPPGGQAFNPPAGAYMPPKQYTAPGVYPHPSITVTSTQPQPVQLGMVGAPQGVQVGLVLPPAVGTEPATITCFNCNKVVTTRVTYTTAWHTHLVAGSVCVITMVCSLCCLGLIPYCFDAFKDAEHYCPDCNTFIGKSSKC